MYYLTLTLSAPLMYFAKDRISLSRDYDTETHPTKSAVCGMIGCAMGLSRGDDRMETLKALTYKYRLVSGDATTVRDFQTSKPLWPEQRFQTAGDPQKTKPGGIIKHVHYIADSTFEVYVGSDNVDTLKTIHDAFLCPKWAVYIGKRSLVPTKPIVPTEFSIIEGDEINGYNML